MVQMETSVRLSLESMLSRREQLVLIEIGLDSVSTASSFVEYMSDSYCISKSSIWYTLKRLKERGFLDFATKDERGKSLELTKSGRGSLQLVEHSRSDILRYFSGAAMSRFVGARNYAALAGLGALR